MYLLKIFLDYSWWLISVFEMQGIFSPLIRSPNMNTILAEGWISISYPFMDRLLILYFIQVSFASKFPK